VLSGRRVRLLAEPGRLLGFAARVCASPGAIDGLRVSIVVLPACIGGSPFGNFVLPASMLGSVARILGSPACEVGFPAVVLAISAVSAAYDPRMRTTPCVLVLLAACGGGGAVASSGGVAHTVATASIDGGGPSQVVVPVDASVAEDGASAFDASEADVVAVEEAEQATTIATLVASDPREGHFVVVGYVIDIAAELTPRCPPFVWHGPGQPPNPSPCPRPPPNSFVVTDDLPDGAAAPRARIRGLLPPLFFAGGGRLRLHVSPAPGGVKAGGVVVSRFEQAP
jgi:hypothetical protein